MFLILQASLAAAAKPLTDSIDNIRVGYARHRVKRGELKSRSFLIAD